MKRRLGIKALLLGAFCLLGTALVWAQKEPTVIPVKLYRRGQQLQTQFDVSSSFTETFRKRVSGGLRSRVHIKTELLDAQGQTISSTLRSCHLAYSLWDELLYLSVITEKQSQPKVRRFLSIDKGISACGLVKDLAIGSMGTLSKNYGYRVKVSVLLNPISEEMRRRSREFMSNPKGGPTGGTNAVIRAVAGLFRSKEGSLGERFIFISKPLSRPDKEAQ